MIHIALQSGYSFKRTYGHLEDIINGYSNDGRIGISDFNNTFSFYYIEKLLSADSNIKPIYGVRITVVKDATEKVKPRGQFGPEYIFIAKNQNGLKEIYNLVRINYENFYYRGNISFRDVTSLSDNVIVIAEDAQCTERLDYIALTTSTPNYMYEVGKEEDIPFVAIVNNDFSKKEDFGTYELLVGGRNSSHRTYPQHILSTKEWSDFQKFKNRSREHLEEAIENTHVVFSEVESFKLPFAPMIKAKGKTKIGYLCKIGARAKGINITEGEYADRYNREMALIKERGYDDYFIVVADMISKAKKKMLVGPGRGSSGGSLVCYLMGITEVDPLVHGLLFERFIDVNRTDLPDIDVDFPDTLRDKVIKQLEKDYGIDKVKRISNISRNQPKGAIGEFAKALMIPKTETEAVKNAIIERSGGDVRSRYKMQDTFAMTDIGKEFIKKYPKMALVSEVEGHPSHTSTHAAGIIVCNEPVSHYAGVNARDNTAMVDKKSSEYQNLLKIDVLGLRTLSVLGDCAKTVGMDHKEFYSIKLDDQKSFDLLSEFRVHGIFQFEGYSLLSLLKQMGIQNFDDIVSITALARPGALYSGGATRFIKRRTGEEKVHYIDEMHERITKDTYGIVVYQEQILMICREVGRMSWEDVNNIRRGLSKSLGEEFLDGYKKKFIGEATKGGYSMGDAEFIWGEICYGGNYAFNKSHAVAYGLVSYWCAYMKSRYPLEFVVACLNNEKNTESSIKILRDAVEHDGIEYDAIDPDNSELYWSVHDGRIIGGLTSLKGIGVAKARKIIKCRNGEANWTPALTNSLLEPKTPFENIYPVSMYFGEIFDTPKEHGLSSAPKRIVDVTDVGMHTFIGMLRSKNTKDLNEAVNLAKRGGKVLTENSTELVLKIEDDTDSILVSIGRFNFEKIGREIAEYGKVDSDYYIIMGSINKEGSRYISVKNIMLLDKYGYGFEEKLDYYS